MSVTELLFYKECEGHWDYKWMPWDCLTESTYSQYRAKYTGVKKKRKESKTKAQKHPKVPPGFDFYITQYW